MTVFFPDAGPKSQTLILLIFSLLLPYLLQLTLFENSKIISKHLNEMLNECIIYYIIILYFLDKRLYISGCQYFCHPCQAVEVDRLCVRLAVAGHPSWRLRSGLGYGKAL